MEKQLPKRGGEQPPQSSGECLPERSGTRSPEHNGIRSRADEHKVALGDLTPDQMETFFAGLGERTFRARQVFSWINRGVVSFAEMTDLPKALRTILAERAVLPVLETLQVQRSRDGTRKYLFGLADGSTIESVFMRYKYGNSACLSSQAGCRMGCRFCASGLAGLQRDLTPGEMLGQILALQRDTGEKISHVVVMGTGEPFDNYDNLVTFIRNSHHAGGLGLSLRNITVSTCGLIPRIRQMALDLPQVNLAISLHSADSKTRAAIMPVERRYPVDELLAAYREYAAATGRRVTFEYTLIRGQTDGEAQIRLLADKLRGMLCHVNLIPLNRVAETGLAGTDRKRAAEIAAYLEKRGVPATVRRELGADIDAACGQLRLGR